MAPLNPHVPTGGYALRSQEFYQFYVDLKINPNVEAVIQGLNLSRHEWNEMRAITEEILEEHEIVHSLRYRKSQKLAKAIVLPLLKEAFPDVIARTPHKEFLDHMLIQGLIYRTYRNLCVRHRKTTNLTKETPPHLDRSEVDGRGRKEVKAEDSESEIDHPKDSDATSDVKSGIVLLQAEGRDVSVARALRDLMVWDRRAWIPSFDKLQQILWTEYGYDHETDEVHCILSAEGEKPKIRIKTQEEFVLAIQACLNTGVRNIRIISTITPEIGSGNRVNKAERMNYHTEEDYEDDEDVDEDMDDQEDIDVDEPRYRSVGFGVDNSIDRLSQTNNLSPFDPATEGQLKKNNIQAGSSPEIPYLGHSGNKHKTNTQIPKGMMRVFAQTEGPLPDGKPS